MKLLALVAATLAFASGVAACGGSGSANGPFAVRKGMTAKEVRATAGAPYRVGGPYGRGCWFYRAVKRGTSIDGMRFCFSHGRVSLVQTATHLGGLMHATASTEQACNSSDLRPVMIVEGNMTGVLIVAKLAAKRPCLLAGRATLAIQRRGRTAAISGNPLVRPLGVTLSRKPRPVVHGRWENWCQGTRGMSLRLTYRATTVRSAARIAPACLFAHARSRLLSLPLYPDYP
jgi:hypothetical protein